MKVMVISDIHGSLKATEQIMIRFKEEAAEKLLILGDFSNYGDTKYDLAISEILNEISNKIVAVRGNGDGFEIDELMDFKLEDVVNLEINGIEVTMTHGHYYRKTRLPENCGKIFLQGHSHCAEITRMDDKIIANPGSISIPRNGAEASYITMDEEKIVLKNLQGKVLEEMEIKMFT